MISAIVVNYNGAELLSACLESLCTQTYSDLEVKSKNDQQEKNDNDENRPATSNLQATSPGKPLIFFK